TWMGLSKAINDFRENILRLPRLSREQAHRMMNDTPHTYCWSPSLVPKPRDWDSKIDVCGFFFVNGAANREAQNDLEDFLKNSDQRPLYIGFGSMNVDDRHKIFKIVRDALEITQRRAVVSGSLVSDNFELPPNIFPCGDCPHDWLFQHVDGVCHHGGAGTTAAGLRAGLPTIIVPFFGDQFFWGEIVAQKKVGPAPLPVKNLNTQDLVKAIQFISEPQVKENARNISRKIRDEDGCLNAMNTFHHQLPLDAMRSDLESTYAACCTIPKYSLKISWPVAEVLLNANSITGDDLRPWNTKTWNSAESCKLRMLLRWRTSEDVPPYSDADCQLILTKFNDIVHRASHGLDRMFTDG
ncbi:unnamed protein product, partial [Rotaria socialis]